MSALNQPRMTALILLDLSATFNTINHKQLLNRLHNYYGISDIALSWNHSYLSDRNQSVKINGFESTKRPLNTGVPQGSVLEPLLFTLYTAPLSSLIRAHDLNTHSYAELYLAFHSQELDSELACIETCLEEVRKWMLSNFLKLNDNKTEFFINQFETQLQPI